MQEQKTSFNLEMIKKNILYDTLAYNLQEEKQKRNKKQQQRLQELQYFGKVNRRVSTEVQIERQAEKQKKIQKQTALASQYEKQMTEKKKVKELEIKINRSYGQIEQKNQQHYHNRRNNQIARIYKKQGFNAFAPLERRRKRDENLEQQKRLETEPPVSYKDYLEKEIDRRKFERQSQKRSIRQRQKIIMERLSKQAENEANEERAQARKQKLSYKIGLDQQIASKRIK